jgi:poly(ADP-ribose) glycohydrolase
MEVTSPISTGHLAKYDPAFVQCIADFNTLLVRSGNTNVRTFNALEEAVEQHFSDSKKEFYEDLLPWMVSMTTQTIPVELLRILSPGNIRLYTKPQCAIILCYAFLCCFRNRTSTNCICEEDERLPSINLDELLSGNGGNKKARIAKIRMILEYFVEIKKRIKTNDTRLLATLLIEVGQVQEDVFLSQLDRPLLPVVVRQLGESIDDAKTAIRIDFANEIIGGGAIAYGCVQEEIMFSICPELIVSRLVVPTMEKDVAVAFLGSEQFTFPKGYAFSLQYGGPYSETQTAQPSCILAVDALNIESKQDQFDDLAIRRELIKFAAGLSCRSAGNYGEVATGNWGCGAFGGDPELKALIQWIVVSAYQKEMHYFPFDNELVFRCLGKIVTLLTEKEVKCVTLWAALKDYRKKRLTATEGVFGYIERTFR